MGPAPLLLALLCKGRLAANLAWHAPSSGPGARSASSQHTVGPQPAKGALSARIMLQEHPTLVQTPRPALSPPLKPQPDLFTAASLCPEEAPHLLVAEKCLHNPDALLQHLQLGHGFILRAAGNKYHTKLQHVKVLHTQQTRSSHPGVPCMLVGRFITHRALAQSQAEKHSFVPKASWMHAHMPQTGTPRMPNTVMLSQPFIRF